MKTRATDITHIGRILKRADFLRVQHSLQNKTGRKWITPHLIIQMAPCAEGITPPIICRYGMTITKKIFPRAVDRNRVRRRLHPLILAAFVAMPAVTGHDFVILPRLPALKATPEELEKDIKWALKRLLAPEKQINIDKKEG